MAEIITGHEFKSAIRRKHDWASWLDGRQWKLTSNDFGDAKPKYVASQARVQAAKRGLKVRITLNEKDGWLILQAFKAEVKAEEALKLAEVSDRQEAQEQEEELSKGRKGRKGKKS